MSGKKKPKLKKGERHVLWLGLCSAAAAAVWLMGWPTRPGPFPPTASYFVVLLVLAGAAAGAAWHTGRRSVDGLKAFLSKRVPLLMIAGGALAGLLLTEGVLRATGLAEWGAGQGPLQPSFRLARYRLNSSGFRGPDIGPKDIAGKGVILGLGDSFTFGQGVAWEETYLRRLEARLNSDPVRRTPVVTVNAAKPGWNTVNELRFLTERGFSYRPGMVIVQFTLNDPELSPYYLLPILPWAGWEARVLWRSHLWFYLVRAHNLRTRPYEDFIRSLYRPESREWRVFSEALKVISAECRRRRAAPVLLMFPVFHDLENYLFEREHKQVADAARTLGFRVVDLLDDYRAVQEPTKSLRVSRGDWHPNAKAHGIAAERLAAELALAR